MDLDRLAALADAATPGPWTATGYVGEDDDGRPVRDPNEAYAAVQGPGMAEDECVAMEALVADAAFIAAARQAIPELIQQVRRYEAMFLQIATETGEDTSSIDRPEQITYPPIDEYAFRAVRQLREDYEAALDEAEPIQEGRPAR